MTASFTHRLQRRSNHLRLIIGHPSPLQLSKKLFKKKEMLGFFHLVRALGALGNLALFVLITQMKRQVSPAGTSNCDRQVCSCPTTCGPHPGSRRSVSSQAQHPEPNTPSPQGSPSPQSLSGLGSRKFPAPDLCGILSLTDLSFRAKLLSVQPTQLMAVLYFSQFSLLHPQLC